MSETAVPFSPIALVGTIALLAAYAVAAWCAAAGIAGNALKSRRFVSSSVYGLYGFGALIGLASALMIYAFVTHDFAIKYVAETSDTTMSTAYKITAFWGGLDGSLLFWVLVLALFSTVAILINHRRHRDMIGYVVATIMIVQVFFLSLLIFTKNPFSTFLTHPPIDGKGLNPLLQNYWMVIHPPSLYTGFVAATIPFAFAIGALASGRLDDLWLGSVRVWMLICFGFLSLGLILGGRWAYEELGWGGYWAWDPVEDAGFMPWFTATAFLHSAIIQEQRGTMKLWNLSLVVTTFFLTIFGTFMTRSGAVKSVHAFGEDNVLALQFIAFMALIAIVSVGLIVYRANKLATETRFESFWSREFAFLLNNWILLGCAFFVLFSTMWPTITEGFGDRQELDASFYNKWMPVLGLILLFLAGAAPLLAWRKTTRERLWNQFMFPTALAAATVIFCLIVFPQTKHLSPIFARQIKVPLSLINFAVIAFTVGSIGQEFWRGIGVRRRQTGSDPITSLLGLLLAKRRKYGGYIVHLGIAVLFLGFAGKAYDQQIDRTLDKPGQSFKFNQYRFEYQRLIHTSDDHKDAITAQVAVYDGDDLLATVYPAKWDFHKAESQMTTEVAIKVRPTEDVYVVLTGYDTQAGMANFRVYINPLILWVWVGAVILIFVGLPICLIPQSIVDAVQGWKPRTPIGRAADVSIVIGIVMAAILGVASQARADTPAAGAEHVPAGMGMGAVGGGWAAKYRPTNATEERAMKDMLCPCSCAHQTIFDCDCQTAAELRQVVIELMASADMKTDEGRKAAYDRVLEKFAHDYGKEFIATPRSSTPWLVPTLAVLGGVGLLVVIMRRARKAAPPPPVPPPAAGTTKSDDDYEDKLEDELSHTD